MSGIDSESAGADGVDASTVEDDTPDLDDESDQAGAEFVKRKFSLTREIDNDLDSLADNQYGGNRSRCVRCAIRNHKRPQQNDDEIAIKKLSVKVDKLSKKIEEMREFVEENVPQPIIIQQSSQEDDSVVSIENHPSPDETSIKKHARTVCKTIEKAGKTNLSQEHIVEKSDLSEEEVRLAIAFLENKGMLVEKSDRNPSEYRLASQDQGEKE